MKLIHINRTEYRHLHPDYTAYVQATNRDSLLVLADMIRESELFGFALTSVTIEPAMVSTASNETPEVKHIAAYRLKPRHDKSDIENMYLIRSWLNDKTE